MMSSIQDEAQLQSWSDEYRERSSQDIDVISTQTLLNRPKRHRGNWKSVLLDPYGSVWIINSVVGWFAWMGLPKQDRMMPDWHDMVWWSLYMQVDAVSESSVIPRRKKSRIYYPVIYHLQAQKYKQNHIMGTNNFPFDN